MDSSSSPPSSSTTTPSSCDDTNHNPPRPLSPSPMEQQQQQPHESSPTFRSAQIQSALSPAEPLLFQQSQQSSSQKLSSSSQQQPKAPPSAVAASAASLPAPSAIQQHQQQFDSSFHSRGSHHSHSYHSQRSSSLRSLPEDGEVPDANDGDDLIDKNLYFHPNAASSPSANLRDEHSESSSLGHASTTNNINNSNWLPVAPLRPVPAFYPLEKSTRLVEFDTPQAVAARLSECLRYLSIQADYDNQSATASLLTAENVEMCLSLWASPSSSSSSSAGGTIPTTTTSGVLVELQRRKGDSMVFHGYARHILDAAVGVLDITTIPDHMLSDVMYSKKVQRLLQMEMDKSKHEKKSSSTSASSSSGETEQQHQQYENAMIALEIAHGLLMKDRMDARRLGLESLCLLSDPRKTGYTTAVLCSHVVLLGSTQGVHLNEVPGVRGGSGWNDKKQRAAPSAGNAASLHKDEDDEDDHLLMLDEGPFQEIREAILSLVQFSRIGEDEMDELLQQENAHDWTGKALTPEAEQMTVLHNLALAVLANALDVVEHPERYDTEPEDASSAAPQAPELHNHEENDEDDCKPRARLRTASSSEVANDFLQQTEQVSPGKELLHTLISELGKAQHKPHNATLSAKCLGSLCRASDEAKRRAKELGAKNVVSTALDVGVRTHLKLETECKKVVQALERVSNQEEEQRQQQEQQQHPRPPPPPPGAAGLPR